MAPSPALIASAPIRVASCLLLAAMLLARTAQGQVLELDKDVYQPGESIRLFGRAPAVNALSFVLRSGGGAGRVSNVGGIFDGTRRDLTIERRVGVPSRPYSLWLDDSNRAYLDVTLQTEIGGVKSESASHRILVVYPSTPDDGLLAVAPEPGGRYRVRLTRLPPKGVEWRMQWLRLGRVMPGGAVEPDVLVAQRYPVELGQDWVVEPDAVLPLGFHEVRVIDRDGVVLARKQLSFSVPVASQALRVEPAQDKPYSGTAPPLVTVAPLPGWPAWASVESHLYRIKRHGLLESDGGLMGLAVGGLPRSPDGPVLSPLRPIPGNTLPGHYRAQLSWSMPGLPLTRYTMATREFDVGEGLRAGEMPVTDDPPIADNDVHLSLDKSTVEPGETVTVTVELKPGLENEPLYAALYFTGYYTFGCARVEGRYIDREVAVNRGTAHLVVPAGPLGAYEIHLLRAVRPSGLPKNMFRPLAVLVSIGFSGHSRFAEPLGIASLSVEARFHSGAAKILSPQLGKPVEFVVDMPSRPSHHYLVGLWRSSEIVPGGATRPVLIEPARGPRQPKMFDGPHFTGQFPPIHDPGTFELRIFDRDTGLVVARSEFTLDDPANARLPPELLPRPGAFGGWPAPTDAQRRLAAWHKPERDCRPPSFDSPPTLRLVRWVSGNTEDPADDRYEPIDRPVLGFPVLVEARFGKAPSDDVYKVRSGSGQEIKLKRTTDPRVFRSAPIVVTP